MKMETICSKCNINFHTKQRYYKHINKKYSCYQKNIINNDNQCQFCNNILSSKSSLSKHIHNFCKQSPFIKKKLPDSQTIDASSNSNSTTIVGNNNIINNINIYINDKPAIIDGIHITKENIKYLDLSNHKNIKYLINNIPSLQNPLGKEIYTHINQEDFIKIFEHKPLVAFEKYLQAIHHSPKNRNMTIFNKHYPYISYICDNMHLNLPKDTPHDRNNEIKKVTNVILKNFLNQYKIYRIYLCDTVIDKYVEFEHIINNTPFNEYEYKANFRSNELWLDNDAKETDNIYIIEPEKNIQDFNSHLEYSKYYQKYREFDEIREKYNRLYECYKDNIIIYQTEPHKIVKGFLSNYSRFITPIIKEHCEHIEHIKKIKAYYDSLQLEND